MNQAIRYGLMLVMIAILVAIAFVEVRAGKQGSYVMNLNGLPGQACPTKAELIIAKDNSILLERIVTISGCSRVSLDELKQFKSGDYQGIIKVPMALAKEFAVSLPNNQDLNLTLSYGDINQDNVINNQDQIIVSKLIFNSDPDFSNYTATADLNKDGKIDAIDLAIVGKNIGVGVVKFENISNNINYLMEAM